MIIDFHTHIFSPEIKNNRNKYLALDPLFAALYSNPKARLVTADELIETMDKQHIDISVVLNIDWHSEELCIQSNDYIMESISRYPKRLIGFCMVKLDSPDSALKEMERCSKNGIKGVGEIRPQLEMLHDTARIRPVINYIEKTRFILLTHTSEPVGHIYPGKGSITPEALYPFIANFPGLKLICAHWGGGMPFYFLMPEVKKALANVYFDTAASPFLYDPAVYKQTIELAGTEKIVFGSDYPLLTPQRLLAEIEALGLGENIKTRILNNNAAHLLGI